MGFVFLLALGLVLAYAVTTIAIIRAISHPPRRGYAWAVSRSLPGDPSELPTPIPFTAFTITGPRGPLAAWDIPGLVAASSTAPTLVFTPGWGESKISVLARLDLLRPHVARIIAFDLPGMGDSPGRCTQGLLEPADLRAVLATLPPGTPVILHGNSLGAGVVLAAAPLTPHLRAVIAECPYCTAFTPARNFLRHRHLPHRVTLPLALAWIALRHGHDPRWRAFDRLRDAQNCPAPLLILHGLDDHIAPPADGRALAAAAPAGRLIEIPAAGHTDLWTLPDARVSAAAELTAFLRMVAAPAAIAEPAPAPQPPAAVTTGGPRPR